MKTIFFHSPRKKFKLPSYDWLIDSISSFRLPECELIQLKVTSLTLYDSRDWMEFLPSICQLHFTSFCNSSLPHCMWGFCETPHTSGLLTHTRCRCKTFSHLEKNNNKNINLPGVGGGTFPAINWLDMVSWNTSGFECACVSIKPLMPDFPESMHLFVFLLCFVVLIF